MQRSPGLEIDMRRKAVECAYRAKDSISAIIFMEKSYTGYYLLNKKDSALYVAKQVYDLFSEKGRKDLAAGTLGLQAAIYLERKQYSKAKKALDEYENLSGYVKDGKVTNTEC